MARDLPATLEFHESGEDAFFAVVVSEVNGSAVNFKLAPTFTLYMCCRYRLSPKFRPDFPLNKRKDKVMMTAKKVANMMWQTVKVSLSAKEIINGKQCCEINSLDIYSSPPEVN